MQPFDENGEIQPGGLSDAQCRMFLAQDPLDCLQAPEYMVPVCTADYGYRHYYDSSTIEQLKDRFTKVEAWADCRNPTHYGDVELMVREFYLDGAWGQCENAVEFDNAIAEGATRMIGQLASLREDQKGMIGASGIHLAFELYRNVMPWQVPDYEDCGDGIGSNAIGCYESSDEGAVYTPVSDYKSLGYYQSGRDSVYAIGLKPEDWKNL